MNDNNKDNHTDAVRERLESLQNCQKQYTMKQISDQISEPTDSKVTPEDVRSEIVDIINNDNKAAEEGELLYSPSCEGEQQSKDEDEELIKRLIDYRVVLLGFGMLGVLLTSAPLLELLEPLPLPWFLTPLLTGFVLILILGHLTVGVGPALCGVLKTILGVWGRLGCLGVLVVLVLLALVVAPQQISESLASTLLLSSGAFYATIGVYLFSQANTCYSIGADKGNKELYDTGTEISRAGCLVSGGGAVSLTVGIFITIFNFSFPHYSWLKTVVLFDSVLVSQALILQGLWKHKKQHKWFQELREDEFPEENSGG